MINTIITMRRKLFYYTMLMIAGVFAGSVSGTVGAAIFSVLSAAFWIKRGILPGIIWKGFLVFTLALCMTVAASWRFSNGPFYESALQSESLKLTGLVTAVERIDDANYAIYLSCQGSRILCKYYQKIEQPGTLIGRRIAMEGTLSLPQEAGNPKTFDYRTYLWSCGIAYTAVIESFDVTSEAAWGFYRLKGKIFTLREAFVQKLGCSETVNGVLQGILFGDKRQIEDDIYDAFRINGTAHILAVSGLHVGMLYSIYRFLYQKWKFSWITAVFLLLLFIYGTAALWSVSVTRAVGLILLVMAGNCMQRRYDLLTALSAMAIFSMIKNPYVVFGAGFQMSFLAVVSIVFLQRPFSRIVGEKWSVAFAVQTGLLPYMAYTFNYVSFVGILCNVPIIFLTSILVPMGIGGFFLFFFTGMIIPGLAPCLESMTRLMVWCNQLFTAEGILSFDVVSPPLWAVTMAYGVMFFCASEHFHIYLHRKDWKKVLVPVLLIFFLTMAAWVTARTPFDDAELIFVDVGQGDCLHVRTSKDRNILIDGGGKYGYNVGEKILKPYLLKNRVSKIDLAAATHLHLDHYAGLEELAACYPVEKVMKSGKMGEKVVLGKDFYLEILWPKAENKDSEDENENSLIFMVHHNGLKTLITGDITEEGEAMLLDAYRGTEKLRADILKIAHHGSAYSSSDAFLDAVNPKAAVISVGKNNYGHPSEIVIEKLEKKGIMVFRTDLCGAVGIINRKGNLSICTEKQR